MRISRFLKRFSNMKVTAATLEIITHSTDGLMVLANDDGTDRSAIIWITFEEINRLHLFALRAQGEIIDNDDGSES